MKHKNTWPKEETHFGHFQKKIRVLSFGVNLLQPSEDFKGKYHTLSEIGELNILAWGLELWMATKSTVLKQECSKAS